MCWLPRSPGMRPVSAGSAATLLAGLVFALSLLSAPVIAATATATQDTYLRSGSANQNQGTENHPDDKQ